MRFFFRAWPCDILICARRIRATKFRESKKQEFPSVLFGTKRKTSEPFREFQSILRFEKMSRTTFQQTTMREYMCVREKILRISVLL